MIFLAFFRGLAAMGILLTAAIFYAIFGDRLNAVLASNSTESEDEGDAERKRQEGENG